MLSVVIVLFGSGYVITQATLSQASTADEFASTYITADAVINGGSIVIAAKHTNMFKLPLLAIQGLLPYGALSWVVLNILFVVLTILLWSFLIMKLTGHISSFSLANLFLVSILMASTELGVALSMTTQRHLDYVLLFIFFLLVYKYRLASLRIFIVASLVLAALVASDYFFLTLVPVTVLCVGSFELFAKQKGTRPYREVAKKILVTLIGAVSGILLVRMLVFTGVFTYFGSTSQLKAMTTLTPSIDSVWSQLLILFEQVTKLLGANIFDVPFSKSLILTIPFFCFAILGTLLLWKSTRSKHPSSFSLILTIFLGLVYVAYIANSLAHPDDPHIRFISITPFIFVAIVLLSPMMKKHYVQLFLLATIMLVSGTLRLLPNQVVYAAKQGESQRWVATNKLVIDTLKSKGVKIAYGTIGWSATSWFYSDKQLDVYNMLPCNVRGAVFSNTLWYQDHRTKTAIIRDNNVPSYAVGETWYACDDDHMSSIYGKPKEIITINNSEKRIDILFYDYDVNTRFIDYVRPQ